MLLECGFKNQKKNNMAEYNAKKNYKWTPEDTFEISGEEFGRLLHSFRAILATPEAQNILLVNEANKVMEAKMQEYVEKGVIKEQDEGGQAITVPPKGAKMSVVKK